MLHDDDSPSFPKMNHQKHLPPPYLSMLKESIHRFLTEHRRGVTDFADFSSIFSRMLHHSPDPPLPLLWFYTALEFHTHKFTTKELFHFLVSCSSACDSTKRAAVLAPLIFVFCHVTPRDTELVEGVVSYCSICCAEEERFRGNDVAVLESDFRDLIPVWMVGGGEFGGDDCVKGFFPLVSDHVRKGIRVGCEVGFLAGVVMCEVFLLKMCLVFESGVSRTELEKKLHDSAVQTITGFRNFYFLDTLFRMMLEPVLPVISLLGSENEVMLKEVLYSSVMTIDYPFINAQAGFSLHANNMKDFAITWLFVAEFAVQSAREKGDQWKAMSYVNAFCRSCVPIQLINWVTSQSGIGRKTSRPNVTTPIAFIKWLLVVEEQGLAVFGGETAKHHTKANFITSRTEFMLPVIKHFFNNLDKNLFLNSIHGATEADKLDDDTEMSDSVTDDKLNTACTNGTRKRKEGIEDDVKTQLKFMRCQIPENSVRENSFVFRQQ